MTRSAVFAPWSYRGDGKIERTPAIDGRMVVAGGAVWWHTRIRRHLTSLAAAGTIFVYGRDRTLMAHEAGTGNGPRRGLLR